MTKRSRTILTMSVRFPVPAGMSEKAAREEFQRLIKNNTSKMIMHEAVIKVAGKEVIYL